MNTNPLNIGILSENGAGIGFKEVQSFFSPSLRGLADTLKFTYSSTKCSRCTELSQASGELGS